MTVQSACSTSLLAVAQACQSLLLDQSDMALAGGVSITFPQKRGYLHQEGGMVSADGDCRPFDDDGDGHGVRRRRAVVVLKRLDDAIDDGDHIYAVIRGTRRQQRRQRQGRLHRAQRAGPGRGHRHGARGGGRRRRIDRLCRVPRHGDAAGRSDRVRRPAAGFGLRQAEQPFCAIGSAKANVGHLDVAAGVAGLIRAALALQHREIPPLANFRRPNRHIDAAGSPFYVPTRRRPGRPATVRDAPA